MKILFEKLANYERVDEYSRISVPFSRGELFDKDTVSIVDNLENHLITQAEVLSTYDDGSIKWLLIHFLATLNANRDTTFDIKVIDKKFNYEKMNYNKVLEELVPVTFYININNIEYNFDINLTTIKDYEIIRHNAITTDLLFKYNINIAENKTIEVLFYITLFKDKDYSKMDIKITNINQDDLKISDTYILYKANCEVKDKYIAHSNYKTNYIEANEVKSKTDIITAKRLMNISNEHYPEVFYGAYYGVLRQDDFGIAITIKEAFQNYPKAINVDSNSISVYLIPEEDSVKFNSGVAKTHTLYIQKFDIKKSREEINQRHHQFQMPDFPKLDKSVYKKVDFVESLFSDKIDYVFENYLISLFDAKGYTFGMMNFGDVYDKGYTDQGRGGSHLVFANNEYDYSYFAYLFYIRNGYRRYYDNFRVGTKHMMDVDICHFSKDEYRQDGLIEHSAEHSKGDVVLSHEWLRGLIAYYHETGDIFAKQSFIKMGENILRNLKQPKYSQGFEVNVRETGWALYALVALYEETNDKKYLEACEGIVKHFFDWEDKYGALLAPYTDHTLIRVPFMIAVACNSLYAYYLVAKDGKVRDLIIRACDDLIENCMMETGLFYYKELPSLQRTSNNTLLLEMLANCYLFTNDEKYLIAGLNTFKQTYNTTFNMGTKIFLDNTVLIQGVGTKSFAQSFYPLIKFYNVLSSTNIKYK